MRNMRWGRGTGVSTRSAERRTPTEVRTDAAEEGGEFHRFGEKGQPGLPVGASVRRIEITEGTQRRNRGR